MFVGRGDWMDEFLTIASSELAKPTSTVAVDRIHKFLLHALRVARLNSHPHQFTCVALLLFLYAIVMHTCLCSVEFDTRPLCAYLLNLIKVLSSEHGTSCLYVICVVVRVASLGFAQKYRRRTCMRARHCVWRPMSSCAASMRLLCARRNTGRSA